MSYSIRSKRADVSGRRCVVASALLHLAVVAQLTRLMGDVKEPHAVQAIGVELVALDQVPEPVELRPLPVPPSPKRGVHPVPPPSVLSAAPAPRGSLPPQKEVPAVTAAAVAPGPSAASSEAAVVTPVPPHGTSAGREATTVQTKEEKGGRVALLPPQEEQRRPVARQSGADRVALRQEYLKRSRSLIERHKQYPLMASKRRIEGTVLVAASLERDGTLRHCEVLQSSGSLLLDNAALRSVRSVARFPELPVELQTDYLDFQVPVSFRLSRQ